MITISSKRFRELSSELAAAEWILAHTDDLAAAIALAKGPVVLREDGEIDEILVQMQPFNELNQQAIDDALVDPEVPEPVTPTVTAINPATAVVGGANFTLVVTGTGFDANSDISVGGANVPTTFVSATELSTPIDMTQWLAAISVPVAVYNGAVSSNVVNLEITAVVQDAFGFNASQGEESSADKIGKLKKK
jgi:hypothetical protein